MLCCAVHGEAQAAGAFEYLYVEANSGAAGGGHAAVRFGEETYHFQHDAGLVRAVRESSEHFDYVYRAIGNRGVHASEVGVSDEAYQTLRDAFRRRHLIEEAQIQALESARRDRLFLDLLERRARGEESASIHDTGVRLRGAGYFALAEGVITAARRSLEPPDPYSVATVDDTAGVLRDSATRVLNHLSLAVGQTYGADYLERRARLIDSEIANLRYDCGSPAHLVGDRVPDAAFGYADAYARLALAHIAIDLLRGERTAEPRAFRFAHDPAFLLDAREIETLRAARDGLTKSVVRLVASTRADWGFPALVAIARAVAVDASIRSGTLVVLDVYEKDAGDVAAAEIFGEGGSATALGDEARADFARAGSQLLAAPRPAEELWSRVELTANLLLELERARATGAALRIAPDSPVPSRNGVLDERIAVPALKGKELEAARECARETASSLHSELRRLYRYDVVSRNCVTEIFRTIDAAMAADEEGVRPPAATSATATDDGTLPASRPVTVRARSERLLGGHVDGGAGLNFVPAVSALAVDHAYRVSAHTTLPSYRRYWLERLSSEHGWLVTHLRESNVLTTRLEHETRGDLFLFFTDDTIALRPLYGAANVLVDAGATAAGLLTLPFDRGALLINAARSLAFSMPDLVFANIRKGQNRTLPRGWTDDIALARRTRAHERHAN